MPRLVIFDDSLRGIDLPGAPLIIGRSKKSDIPIRDRLLSRKHCAILPFASGHRLVDLKSSYGTYVNGERVERRDLAFDDIIEIGNTVIVYLDSDAWSRGEGLARLRNPIKAQQLIQRINARDRDRDAIPSASVAGRGRDVGSGRNVADMLPALFHARPPGEPGADLVEVLAEFASFKTVSLWVRRRPDIKRALAEAVEAALLGSLDGGWEEYRRRLRIEIRRHLESPDGEAARIASPPPPPPGAPVETGDGSESTG